MQGDPPSTRRVSLEELAQRINRDPMSGDWYVVAQSQALRQMEFDALLGELGDARELLDPGMARERVALWLGPGGTVTPLHYDLQNALLAQVRGRKRVLLISPDYSGRLYNERGGHSSVDPEHPDLIRFPLFAEVPVSEVVLEAADALFLPIEWWHHVRALAPSISLSLANFRWSNPGF
jgi:ribosomal protein L16 Arg81 hydroxylase